MFKKVCFLMVLVVLVFLAVRLDAAISGVVFGDYYFVPTHHAEKDGAKLYEGQNGLWFRRIYLTYDSDLSDKIKGRIRLEASSDGKFNSAAANITPFIKDAYISYSFLPQHSLTVGLQDSLTWTNIEKFYGYRHLEKTAFDLYKVRSSRDVAISLKGSFDADKKFNYAVQFGNYSGTKQETDKYKQISALLNVSPLTGLILEINGDSTTLSAAKKSTLIQGFAGYSGDWGRIGLNYGQETVKETGKSDVKFGIFSAFGIAKLSKDFEAVLRVDLTADPQPYGVSDYTPIEKGFKTTMLIAGLGWNIHPKLQIMPNIKVVGYTANSSGVKPGSDTYFNITFNYNL